MGSKNAINFYCKRCKKEFDCDVGGVKFPVEKEMPEYEKAIKCQGCKSEYISNRGEFSDKFELTEKGQSQMTALFFDDIDCDDKESDAIIKELFNDKEYKKMLKELC